jgi:hypothetical protein
MARLRDRGGELPRGGVPDVLRSMHDPVWADPVAVARLAARHRLAVGHHVPLEQVVPTRRFEEFRNAWLVASGFVADPHRPACIDWARVRAAGIDCGSSIRERAARLGEEGP